MTSSYTDIFGGSPVQPAEVGYRSVSLTADVVLLWPQFSQGAADVCARIMDVTPSGAGLSMELPDATQVGNGQDTLIRNLGADTITILASGGLSTVGTVASGEAKYFYLTDNSTAAGSWSVVTFGAGTSTADAATLAGYGLKAIGITLNQKHDAYTTTSDISIDSTYRARTVIWTAGTHTCTLPTAASVGDDFFFIAKNGGSGTITFAISGGDTVDGGASVDHAPNDGAIFYSDGISAWFSVGQGRSVSFAFTQLVKSVAGGSNVTLTSAECANKIIQFTGLLTANIEVYVTNTVSIYYVYNNTTGPYSLTVKTVAGTGVIVQQGLRDILECDATNVYQALTNTVATIAFGTGSAGSPSITFIGDTDTGFYNSGANEIGITANGTQVGEFSTAGLTTIGVNFAVAGGTANAMTATIDGIAALSNGFEVTIESVGANTSTTPTININALGAKTIVKGSNIALALSDIPGANYPIKLAYDSSLGKFVMTNPYVSVLAERGFAVAMAVALG